MHGKADGDFFLSKHIFLPSAYILLYFNYFFLHSWSLSIWKGTVGKCVWGFLHFFLILVTLRLQVQLLRSEVIVLSSVWELMSAGFLWLTRIRLWSHVSKDWPGKLSISLTTVSCLHHQSTCLLTWCILCILLYSLICMHDERGSQSCFNDMVISLTVFPLIRWAWRSPCHYRSDYRPSSDEFINSDGNWSWHKPWHILALFLVIFFNSKCFSRMGLTPEH